MTAAGLSITSAQPCCAPVGSDRGDALADTCFGELLRRGVTYAARPRDGIRALPVASPSHFETGAQVSVAALRGCAALPYCFDFDDQQLICTVHRDVEQVFAEPFLHAGQRKYMQAVCRVPWNALEELLRPSATDLQPVLVFSIGRCGSTLLHSLARACTRRSYSEPDTITQLALPPGSELSAPAQKQKLVRYALGPFIASAADRAVVKFRTQVNAIAAAVVEAFPAAKCVFMFRERESWARSMCRSFGNSPVAVARRLARSVRAADTIVQSGASLEIIHYEDLVSSPARTLERLLGADRVLQGDGSTQAFTELLKRDSQNGTSLSRDKLTARVDENAWLQSFHSEWAKIRPEKLLRRLNLDL